MALTVFVVEAQIPLPVPVPGIKLGLANIFTLLVLEKFRKRDAFALVLVRIFLGALFIGQITTVIFSLCGGLLSFAGMALMVLWLHNKYVWFVSVIGAVLHNIGQILAAIFVLNSVQICVFLPFLILAGCITGLFTGFAAAAVLKHWPKGKEGK